MGWTSQDLKVPDEGRWIALVEVTSDGETSIVGYVSPETLQRMAETGREIADLWATYLSR